jgi:hypothetical protein
MRHHRLTRAAALGLALTAFAAPSAAAQQQDRRSPVAREPGNAQAALPNAKDQLLGSAPSVFPDVRSPDGRDPRGTADAPDVMVVESPRPEPVAVTGGIDWADATIGAAGALAVALLAATSGFLVAQRRQGAMHRESATSV